MSIQDDRPLFTVAFLLDRVGPAPTIAQTAAFLRENNSTTFRRLQLGELERVEGTGTARITLKSLSKMLNGDGKPYAVRHQNRGRKPKAAVSEVLG